MSTDLPAGRYIPGKQGLENPPVFNVASLGPAGQQGRGRPATRIADVCRDSTHPEGGHFGGAVGRAMTRKGRQRKTKQASGLADVILRRTAEGEDGLLSGLNQNRNRRSACAKRRTKPQGCNPYLCIGPPS